MNGNGGVMGAALLEELREAVVDFKQSGKFVVAYDETYSQGKYYLASAADKIYMQPEGAMDWSGLAFNLMFYKGLLDKLDDQGRSVPPYGLQIQERRRAVYPSQNVGRQPRADAGAREFDVEHHRRLGRRSPRHRPEGA